jgi:hypothetical protein
MAKSPFNNLHKGQLHRDLGIPEGENIPGGKRKLKQLCHGSIGDHVMVGDNDVVLTENIKKRACFGANFGYRK